MRGCSIAWCILYVYTIQARRWTGVVAIGDRVIFVAKISQGRGDKSSIVTRLPSITLYLSHSLSISDSLLISSFSRWKRVDALLHIHLTESRRCAPSAGVTHVPSYIFFLYTYPLPPKGILKDIDAQQLAIPNSPPWRYESGQLARHPLKPTREPPSTVDKEKKGRCLLTQAGRNGAETTERRTESRVRVTRSCGRVSPLTRSLHSPIVYRTTSHFSCTLIRVTL